jgi:DNA repair protein RadC
MTFNCGQELIDIHLIAQGLRAEVTIDYGRLLRLVVLDNADRVILAHTHPSGQMRVSQPDMVMTQGIQKELKLLRVKVIDHLIIGNNSYISMADLGLLEEL